MKYEVIVRPSAEKFILRLNEPDYTAIIERLHQLAQEQKPFSARKLSVAGLWRLRVRGYRIIYSIDDEKKRVTILRVARRSEGTYKRL